MNKSRSIDSLQPDDLASMSVMAFSIYKWQDKAILYLKESIDLFDTLLTEGHSCLANTFPSTLVKMKEQFSTYHNEILHKKPSLIGPYWKLYPYMVDKGRPLSDCTFHN